MSRAVVVAALLLTVGFTAANAQNAPSARTLRLVFETDGTVTLEAQNVTVREILAEWARQCGCYVVNAQNLTGGPLTMPLLFPRQPQAKVLESLLRQASGYTLTPRRAGSTSVSQFETIYIVATSNASQSPAAYSTPGMPQTPPPTPGSPDDEIPPVVPTILRADPNNATPQQPQPPQPAQTQTPAAQAPRTPGTPGVFVPIVPINSSPRPSSPAPGAPTTPPPSTSTPAQVIPQGGR